MRSIAWTAPGTVSESPLDGGAGQGAAVTIPAEVAGALTEAVERPFGRIAGVAAAIRPTVLLLARLAGAGRSRRGGRARR
ncbi:hypothetical protein [Amycolatopsis sp. NPDC054798]